MKRFFMVASILAVTIQTLVVRAATVITNGTDAELRAAVAACGTVTFDFDGVITLTNPISVSCAVTLDASGHNVVISGGGSNQLFLVQTNASLSLIHLTIANGLRRGTNGITAGFPSQYNGESVFGGAVVVTSGALSAADCLFSNNVVLGSAHRRKCARWSHRCPVFVPGPEQLHPRHQSEQRRSWRDGGGKSCSDRCFRPGVRQRHLRGRGRSMALGRHGK
jgi:hypothetical protein